MSYIPTQHMHKLLNIKNYTRSILKEETLDIEVNGN